MKHAKKAFLASLLSVVLCVTMLVGTTYAWFTDSVTSAGNKIIAGTLDIDLYQWTNETAGTEITTSSAPIFGSGETANAVNASTLWEPGKTQIAYLSIKNNGNLWLKYTVKLVVKNVAKDLYKVMQYEIVPNAQYGALDNDSWATLDGLGKLSLAATDIALGASTTFGTSSTDVPMAPETEHFFALAIHMNEEAGNEYQAGEVDFDIQVLATQYTKEEDSFDDQYDFNATYPITSNAAATMSAAVSEDLIITKSGEIKSATVPAAAANTLFAAATASAPAGSDNELTMNLNVEKVSETTTSTGQVVALEIDMSAVLKTTTGGTTSTSSAPVESLADYVTIEYELGTGLSNVVATHDGHAMDALASAAATTENSYGGYYYDAESGVLTIKTKSFSPYEITYTIPVGSVTLSETELTFTAIGANATLTATVLPAEAMDKEVTWTSGNTAVATVVDGVVTSVGNGTTTITATAGGKSASCTVSVDLTANMDFKVTLNSAPDSPLYFTASQLPDILQYEPYVYGGYTLELLRDTTININGTSTNAAVGFCLDKGTAVFDLKGHKLTFVGAPGPTELFYFDKWEVEHFTIKDGTIEYKESLYYAGSEKYLYSYGAKDIITLENVTTINLYLW